MKHASNQGANGYKKEGRKGGESEETHTRKNERTNERINERTNIGQYANIVSSASLPKLCESLPVWNRVRTFQSAILMLVFGVRRSVLGLETFAVILPVLFIAYLLKYSG